MRTTTSLALGALLAVSVVAEGAQLSLPVTEVGTLANAEGQIRVLLRTESPRASLANARIARATLRVPVRGIGEVRELRIWAAPITTAWSGGALDWDGNWSTPGGDVDRSRGSVTPARFTRDGIALDVTSAVKETAEWNEAFEGLLLAPPPGEREGFRAEEIAALRLDGGARVDIVYRNVGRPRDAARRPR